MKFSNVASLSRLAFSFLLLIFAITSWRDDFKCVVLAAMSVLMAQSVDWEE